jgi:puromycin-sensitive aminopeptidase
LLLQAQFLLDGSSGPGMWIVPITSSCGAYDSPKKFLLKLKRDKLVIASQCGDRKKGGNFWTKLNINGTGFYRVKYDDELAAALQNALETKKLSLMDKIGTHNMWHVEFACNILVAGVITLALQALLTTHMRFPWPASKHWLHCYVYCTVIVGKLILVFFHT